MEIYSANGTYKSCTFTVFRDDSGFHRDNIGKDRSGIQRFGRGIIYYAGHNRSIDRDVIDGRRALAVVVHNETSNLACSLIGDCLGYSAFTSRSGMGIGSDLAVLRFLVFVSELAPTFVVAGNIGNLVRAQLSEPPAFNRGNFHSINCVPILKNSSGRCFDRAAL